MSVFQTVLTRTLIATNIERDLVAHAGIPFKVSTKPNLQDESVNLSKSVSAPFKVSQ